MADADSTAVAAAIETLRRQRDKYLSALAAPNTQRGYSYDMRAFRAWCDRVGLCALPATDETLALYVTHRLAGGRKVSTVCRNAAAIASVHKHACQPSPYGASVRNVIEGAQRTRIETVRQVRPIGIEDLRAISRMLLGDDTPIAARDRAIILTGFGSALRAQQIALLRWPEDLEFVAQGARLFIRREKQDQRGEGRVIGLPHGKHAETCPVTALRNWLLRRGAFAGPVFTRFDGHDAKAALSTDRVCHIVKRCLERIGRNEGAYGSHSMRSGFVTAAGEAGATDLLIAAQTGHRDLSELRKYFRPQDVFRFNTFSLLDL